MNLKKMFHISCILIYLVFSQFVIKALVTTEHANSWSDAFCITKSLNTLDSKQNCREAKNIATFGDIFDANRYVLESYVSPPNIDYWDNLFAHSIPTIRFYSHAPPWEWSEFNSKAYVHLFVWVILLLL